MSDSNMDSNENTSPRQGRLRARSEVGPPRIHLGESPAPATSAEPTRRNTARSRGRAENVAGPGSPFAPPRRAATSVDRDFRSPRRSATTSTTAAAEPPISLLRHRDTALTRRTRAPSTIATRSRITTMGQAGPEDTSALKASQENYVHPQYAELNPAYEQPASSKPVWSLAKPLPRVIRPGMVPTESELDLAHRPGENSQNAGIDVDPVDLAEGRVQPTLDLGRLSAQLKDSRAQREANFVETQRRGTISSRLSRRPTGASSTFSGPGLRRAPSAISVAQMTPLEEAALEEGRLGEELGSPTQQPPRSPVPFPTISEDVLAGRYSEEQSRLSVEHLEPIMEQAEPPTRRPSTCSNLSEETVHVDEEPELYADMTDLDLKLNVDNAPLYDELLNNHTVWSIFRTQHREFLAEFLGVFLQLTIGFCSDISATLNGADANVNTTAWAWGFATMTAIYVSGGISGAHLNPVITIMLWFYRGFPKRKMVPYFLAQFLGAVVAGFTAYGLYSASIRHYELKNSPTDILNGFVPGQRYDYITSPVAFFNEFLGVTFLACAVLALGDDSNAPPGAGMNALVIGFLVTLLNFSFAYQTGAALNPARDFGPRLTMLALGYGTQLFTNPFWFYGPWAGALCGAMVGAALYDIFIFEGGESPINYPWIRTKRSFTKGKKKWVRRAKKTLHVGKKEKQPRNAFEV